MDIINDEWQTVTEIFDKIKLCLLTGRNCVYQTLKKMTNDGYLLVDGVGSGNKRYKKCPNYRAKKDEVN